MKLARDGFARRDAFQKLYTDRFLHRKVYAKFRESCSRVSVKRALVVAKRELL
jgi:hypothetical protein